MSLVLQCTNITKSYLIQKDNAKHQFNALHNVSFTLHEGDRLGLIGLNGSGKSTLLKILGGFIKPTNGHAQLHKKVTSLASFDSILHPDLTAVENCSLQLQLLGYNKSDINDAVLKILSFAELIEFKHQPVKTFSSGMMLRLSFSIFSVTNPEILLLDEVFSTGDINFQRKASELMQYAFQQIPAIIMASHQLTEIQQFCNKCLILDKGEVVFFGSVNDALKYYSNKHTTSETKYRKRKIEIQDIQITKIKFKQSEPIILDLLYKQNEDDLDLNPAIYISNLTGKVLIDSPIFNHTYKSIENNAGLYQYTIQIPSNLLNEGTYFISFYFGKGNDIFVEMQNCISFEVEADEWEKNAGWNIPTDYPIRTRLAWSKTQKAALSD
jgi:ABC-2 type transport system ATP-binding protein